MEEDRSAFKILRGTSAGRRPLGRPMSRWENNIRIDIKELSVNMRNWIDLAQDRDYLRVIEPSGSTRY